MNVCLYYPPIICFRNIFLLLCLPYFFIFSHLTIPSFLSFLYRALLFCYYIFHAFILYFKPFFTWNLFYFFPTGISLFIFSTFTFTFNTLPFFFIPRRWCSFHMLTLFTVSSKWLIGITERIHCSTQRTCWLIIIHSVTNLSARKFISLPFLRSRLLLANTFSANILFSCAFSEIRWSVNTTTSLIRNGPYKHECKDYGCATWVA